MLNVDGSIIKSTVTLKINTIYGVLFKKKEYVRPGGCFTSLPHPNKIFIGRVQFGIQENFRDLEIIPYPNRGCHSGRARALGA